MYFILFLPLSPILQHICFIACLSDVLFAFLTGAVCLCILHQMKSLLLLYGHQQIPINIVINMSGNGQLPIIKVRIMSRTHMYSERLN